MRAQVPLRTFTEWADVSPGHLQADLLAHCGDSARGFFLTSLLAIDVATGWTELQAVWGKSHKRVGAAVHLARCALPMPLRSLHTDNGGEFLNHILVPWCREEGIRFTRGRPYRKNDQAYVEQRNGAVLRRYIGYHRYCTRAALLALQAVHEILRLYVNFFQPVRKLVSKERHGARVRKRYDRAQTPYRRLLASGILTPARRDALVAEYHRLNPLQLRRTDSPPGRALETRRPIREERRMSTVRARRRRARARRPREEQGQQGRTLGNHHSEASPLRSVRGTFDAARETAPPYAPSPTGGASCAALKQGEVRDRPYSAR